MRNTRWILAAILLVLICNAASAWPDSPELEASLDAARQFAVSREFARSVEAFSEIITKWPDDPRAYMGRGQCHVELKERDQAMADFNQAIRLCVHPAEQGRVRVVTLTNRANLVATAGDFDRALRDVDEAIGIDPKFAKAHAIRSALLYRLGDLNGAKESFERVREIEPARRPPEMTEEGAAANLEKNGQSAQGLAARARLLYPSALATSDNMFHDSTSVDEMIELLDKSLELDAAYAEAWCLRGEAADFKEFGSTLPCTGANAFYDKAIAADPNDPRGYALRGLNNLRGIVELHGQYAADHKLREAKAMTDLTKAIKLGTLNPAVYMERADTMKRHDGAAEAVGDYTRALELGGKAEEIYSSRADAYRRLKEWTREVEDLTALIALAPMGFRYAQRGDAYVELKEWDKARADHDRAVADQPEEMEPYLGRARMYRLKGDRAAATADYARAHELDNTVPEVTADFSNAEAVEAERHSEARMIARIMESDRKINESMKKVDASQKKLEKLQKRAQRMIMGDTRTPDDIIAEVTEFAAQEIADDTDFLDRAMVYYMQDKYDEAIEDCESAMHVNRENPKVWELRGACYEEKKELLQAHIDFSEAIKLDGTQVKFWIDRARVHRKSEDAAGAMADLRQALKLDPKSVRALTERATLYYVTDRNDEAIADCDAALAIDPENQVAAKLKALALKDKSGAP